MKKLFDNKIFKVIYTILKVLFFAILILYVLFIALQRFNGNKSILGYRLFTVATSSMSGVYDVNDVIIVKDCNIENLEVGDDIAYIGSRGGLENKLISHRIIRIEDDNGTRLFITKGVQNDVEDPAIRSEQILGEIIGTLPLITQINHIVHTQLGFFCLIFCPLVLVIVLEILQTITDIKLENNELELISGKSSENVGDESNKGDDNSSENVDDESNKDDGNLDENINNEKKENDVNNSDTISDVNIENADDKVTKKRKRNNKKEKKDDVDVSLKKVDSISIDKDTKEVSVIENNDKNIDDEVI